MVKPVITTSAEGETSECFYIDTPTSHSRHAKTRSQGKTEKTALYVPTQNLLKSVKFSPSSTDGNIMVTNDVAGVLGVIFRHGDMAVRYGIDGLEEDPTRQQIIVYTAVVCGNQILWYQRSTPETSGRQKVGEPRLGGMISIGFGGHKTKKDILSGRDELVFLLELMPVVHDSIGTILGLNKGFFNEAEEELGLGRDRVKSVRLLGAFFDKRVDNPSIKTQVAWVHTGIAAVLEVDNRSVKNLRLRKSEMSSAWWSNFDDLEKDYESFQRKWRTGKGAKVEPWTEILIKEFLVK